MLRMHGDGQRVNEKWELVPEDYFRRLRREEIFEDDAPLEIDLGCGDGSFLLAMANQFPERRFLGVERLLGRVKKVCRKIEREGLKNAKVLRLETGYTLEYLLPASCASRVHLLFPDPWPKKKHHRRRFVRKPNMESLDDTLEPDGEFLFKTDHCGYFCQALEVIRNDSPFFQVPWEETSFSIPKPILKGNGGVRERQFTELVSGKRILRERNQPEVLRG